MCCTGSRCTGTGKYRIAPTRTGTTKTYKPQTLIYLFAPTWKLVFTDCSHGRVQRHCDSYTFQLLNINKKSLIVLLVVRYPIRTEWNVFYYRSIKYNIRFTQKIIEPTKTYIPTQTKWLHHHPYPTTTKR